MLRSASLALAAASLLAGLAPALAADLPVTQPEPVLAPAPVVGGFYLGTISAVDFENHTSFNVGGGAVDVRNNYETGYYTGGKLGYALAPIYGLSPRVEFEVGFGDSSVDTHRVNGVQVGAIDSFGELQSVQGYGNLYLDLDISSFTGTTGFLSALRPYIGGGAGVANVQLKKQGVSATGTLIDDDDTNFAYHLDAGVGIDISKLGLFGTGSFFDNTVVEVGYRFADVPDLSFTARDGTRSSTGLHTNMITFGTRKVF